MSKQTIGVAELLAIAVDSRLKTVLAECLLRCSTCDYGFFEGDDADGAYVLCDKDDRWVRMDYDDTCPDWQTTFYGEGEKA